MKTKILLLALFAISIAANATDKKVATEVVNSTEIKSAENKPAAIELKAPDTKSDAKSCDTKSGK